jgi:AraC-like DNA-binding protein
MSTSAGYDLVESPSYDWNGRRRGDTPFVVVQHTLSGRGNLTYDGRHHTLEAGATMLVTIPHNHRYWLAAGDRWEFFWIVMSGEEAVRIHRAAIATSGPVLHLSEKAVADLAQCCLALMAGEGETAGRASAIAYQATMALYDDALGARAEPAPEAGQCVMAAAAAFIRDHLDRDLSGPAVARMTGLSRAHFTRVFAAHIGSSPGDYVLEQRMRGAARLLENSELPIKAVASASGFRDANYFAKAFRRTFGVSPTEFRTTGMYATRR